ncbi:glycosyltransferase [Paenarthrobacter sp. NPDC018779]|uniref:glycosyltransferase n=1 Tax=Paenarthrobacter sp. NPDC018779 TaxID=3364375 RepID=UPI0037C51613
MAEQKEGSVDVDYGSTMVVDDTARDAEILALRRLLIESETPAVQSGADLSPGISVIIPSYLGSDRIAVCLQSLFEQTLNPASFEIILIINGSDDGTYGIATTLRDANPGHHFRILYQVHPSAGAARNVGIDAARFEYLTFVDDDDYVGPKFLERLLAAASPTCVSISPIVNVDAQGNLNASNPVNVQISARGNKKFSFKSVSTFLGLNACKLLPTKAVKKVKYSELLRSGEDVCFMARLAVENNFEAVVATTEASGSYFRILRDESISRQPLNFDFAVIQRLEVIQQLESHKSWDSSTNDGVLNGLIKSQANFIKRYLNEHPNERQQVTEAVDAFNLKDFPWSLINAGNARGLVVSYCFAPYSDTSAVVASKAIVERGDIVDVIYNNMGSVRRKDSNLETIASRFIDSAFEIDAPPSFAGWKQISEFVKKGLAIADRRDMLVGGYETLYSRVLWPGSHFLAAKFKIQNPNVVWTAEFSDPMSTDAQGKLRPGDLIRDELFEEFEQVVVSRGFESLETNSLFTWCEYVTYILADELIFTNENQLTYMLSYVSDPKLKEHIQAKSTVRVHPTPPSRSYEILPAKYELAHSVVNVGYFGAFYENRGLMEVLTALANSSAAVRRKLRLHVFTNKPDDVIRQVQEFGLMGIVKAQGYRPYLEFLNLTTKFDVLLVNDVERTGEMAINPFLPSKYSDYVGSGQPVWGLLDEGSPLSAKPLAYSSAVGNAVQAVRVLEEILADWQEGSGIAAS